MSFQFAVFYANWFTLTDIYALGWAVSFKYRRIYFHDQCTVCVTTHENQIKLSQSAVGGVLFLKNLCVWSFFSPLFLFILLHNWLSQWCYLLQRSPSNLD